MILNHNFSCIMNRPLKTRTSNEFLRGEISENSSNLGSPAPDIQANKLLLTVCQEKDGMESIKSQDVKN